MFVNDGRQKQAENVKICLGKNKKRAVGMDGCSSIEPHFVLFNYFCFVL